MINDTRPITSPSVTVEWCGTPPTVLPPNMDGAIVPHTVSSPRNNGRRRTNFIFITPAPTYTVLTAPIPFFVHDLVISGLVGFILLINCCISLLGKHNDGVNLYDFWRTPVLLENWHTVTYQN